MIIISFPQVSQEVSEFVLSRFRGKKDTLLFICAESRIVLLSWLSFRSISKIVNHGVREGVKKRSGEGRGRTDWGFLGFRWGVYFTAAVPGT